MERTRRRGLRGLATVLAVAAGCLAGAMPAAAAGSNGTPGLDWADCGDGFQCATAHVPRDYSRPMAGTVDIAVIRKPATGPDRIGTLFTNPGGPGGSGTGFVRDAISLYATLNDRFDIVGWDPRGAGESGPVSCLTAAQREARWPKTDPFPTLATLDPTARQAKELADGCAAADTDRTLSGFTTENAARDLDQLRRLVGDPKLNYLGFSYGTYLGAMYAALFPGKARTLVLDGALDPDQYTNDPLQNLVEQSAGFEDSLDRFFAWCATSPLCGFQGGRPAYDALVKRVLQTPLPATASGDPRPVLAGDLQNATVGDLYARQAWPDLAFILTEAQKGDGSAALALSDALRGRIDGETYAPDIDAFVETSCADLSYPRSARAFARYEREAKRSPFVGLSNLWGESAPGYVCAVWKARAREQYTGPFRFRQAKGGAPALVVGNTHDPATPLAGAVSLTRQLGKARLLVMDGDGHTAYGGNSACIDSAVDAYLEDLAVPAAGTVCDQEVVDPDPAAAPVAAGAGLRRTTAGIARLRVG
ncbi:MAG: alpha/beta hydrolase [Thermoleophilia bacterium]